MHTANQRPKDDGDRVHLFCIQLGGIPCLGAQKSNLELATRFLHHLPFPFLRGHGVALARHKVGLRLLRLLCHAATELFQLEPSYSIPPPLCPHDLVGARGLSHAFNTIFIIGCIDREWQCPACLRVRTMICRCNSLRSIRTKCFSQPGIEKKSFPPTALARFARTFSRSNLQETSTSSRRIRGLPPQRVVLRHK